MSDTRLWCDVPKEEKAEFLRSGRAWETGIIAKAIAEEVASVYDELAVAKALAKQLLEAIANHQTQTLHTGSGSFGRPPDEVLWEVLK